MPYLMTDTKVERPTCTRITITRDIDPDPDLSWLEEDCWNDYQEGSTMPDGGVDYGRNRIQSYQDGEWWCITIAARAKVLVPMDGSSIIQQVESGGLWGIDYDPETPKDERDAYLTEIEQEQVDEVRAILTALGIDHEDAEIVKSYSA